MSLTDVVKKQWKNVVIGSLALCTIGSIIAGKIYRNKNERMGWI